MNRVRAANPRLQGLVPYDPKYLPAAQVLSANENPLNIPEEVKRVISRRLKGYAFNRYPDPLANDLRAAIAAANGLDKENVLVGNGGDELLFALALAYGGPGRRFLNLPPTFSVYEGNAVLTGTETVEVPRRSDYSIDEGAVLERVARGDIDYVIVTSPNNPTGQLADEDFMQQLLESTDALVLIDEAYFEFSRRTMRPYLAAHENLLILRTFSKAFSLAGVRMGYVLGNPSVINELMKVRQPYSVDSLSQLVALAVYENRALFEKGIMSIIEERRRLISLLEEVPQLTVYPSDSNYILFKVADAAKVWEGLYDRGVLVRDLSQSRFLDDCLRVSIGTREENDAFFAALGDVLAGGRA